MNSNDWLIEYERKRTNPYEKNDKWVSSKYNIIGLTWDEISKIEIANLPDKEGNPMTFGQACSALKKTWRLFNAQKKVEGIYMGDLAYRIIRIQRALGIEQSHFPQLNEEWVDHELTLEEKQLKQEEQEEDDWIMDPEENDEEEEDEDEDWENW